MKRLITFALVVWIFLYAFQPLASSQQLRPSSLGRRSRRRRPYGSSNVARAQYEVNVAGRGTTTYDVTRMGNRAEATSHSSGVGTRHHDVFIQPNTDKSFSLYDRLSRTKYEVTPQPNGDIEVYEYGKGYRYLQKR